MSHETPADLREAARDLYRALDTERLTGFLTEEAIVRVYAVGDHGVHVVIGGLSDEFILLGGSGVPQVADIDRRTYFTPEANRLAHRIEDTMRERLPRTPSGELRFAFRVWLMPEPFWRTPVDLTPGVVMLRKDDPA